MAEGDAELADLYRDVLIDYYRSPARKGQLPAPDFRSHGANPLCGDEVDLTMTRADGRITAVRYAGRGCVISQASAAMMAEALEGRALADARGLIEAFCGMLLKGEPAASLPEALEETRALEGVRKFPIRIKCALLPWNTMRLGLETDGRAGAPAAEYMESERGP